MPVDVVLTEKKELRDKFDSLQSQLVRAEEKQIKSQNEFHQLKNVSQSVSYNFTQFHPILYEFMV